MVRSLVHLLRAFPVIFHIMTYASGGREGGREEAAVAVKWPRAREEEVEKKKAVTMAGCHTGWFNRMRPHKQLITATVRENQHDAHFKSFRSDFRVGYGIVRPAQKCQYL